MKTATAALIDVLHICGPEVLMNSEMYSSAMSRDQAAIVFNLAAKIIRMNSTLNDFVTIRETLKELHNPSMGVVYKALSADAPTAYGLSPALVIHDELGQVKGPRHPLYEALETATAAHESPLSIVISTQAPSDADLLSILIDDARQGNDPRTKLILFTAPEDMDPFSEEAVRLANPGLGDIQNQEEVMAMAEDARRMPSREAEYRNLVLNQRVEAYNPFVSKQIWIQSGEVPSFQGPAYGGLDLSETNDLTAFELVFPQGDTYDVKSHFWLPGDGLEERSRKDRVPYDQWHDEGHLLTTPGRSIEYEFVADFIADLFTEYDIRKIAFDRYNMRHLRPWLIKAGLSEAVIDEKFVEFGQGYVSMGPALRVLESLLLNAKLKHGNHPLLNMCAANSVVKHNEAGDRKLDKAKSRGRIDGMVSLAMACSVANEESGKSKVFPVDLEDIMV
jgi:phage terminase large subunit-like protein